LILIFCASFGYLYFLFFRKWTRIEYINQPGMALTLFPSSVGWDEIQTHDLSIMNPVCYPLDQTFACKDICFGNSGKWIKLKSNHHKQVQLVQICETLCIQEMMKEKTIEIFSISFLNESLDGFGNIFVRQMVTF